MCVYIVNGYPIQCARKMYVYFIHFVCLQYIGKKKQMEKKTKKQMQKIKLKPEVGKNEIASKEGMILNGRDHDFLSSEPVSKTLNNFRFVGHYSQCYKKCSYFVFYQ